jgi:hypothetical protein
VQQKVCLKNFASVVVPAWLRQCAGQLFSSSGSQRKKAMPGVPVRQKARETAGIEIVVAGKNFL